jgi:hypothetical protein
LKEAKAPNSHYGSTPQPMFFNNGCFNPRNWNGGDDIIRQFISKLEDSKDGKEVFSEIDYEDKTYDILCYWSWLEDHQYVTFLINSFDIPYVDIAFFRVYKHRGATELAMYNSELMHVDQYVFLLNLIEKTGFKFQ